jgi:CRP-like cAMP-binding protein
VCFKKNEVIFDDQDEGNEMYFIDTGRIKIVKKVGDTEGILAILNAGDFFGEMALITGNKRTATASALTDCKLRIMDKKTFDSNLENDKAFMKNMLETLAHRLEETDLNLSRYFQRVLRLSKVFKIY